MNGEWTAVDVATSERHFMIKLQSLSNFIFFFHQTIMNSTSIVPNLPPSISSSRNKRNRIAAIVEVSAITSDSVAPQITWQIIVGSIAGVSPFVVAGIEFNKRIVAQKKCIECGGSGLVLIEKEYIRCPNCGGFLPWQSWKRFFSG